ncbi:MAG: peptidylprolyl isomerase [Alphaproteobacteria bacterium]|nr:peptidylprolyl isomerase [Alphaproteobacteria bacterium]
MTAATSKPGRVRAVAARLVREPMVHFLAAGALLFGLNSVVNGGAQPVDVVTISEGRIAQIAESFRLLSNRAPSQGELAALVDDFVREEISYREAVALGLDADDTVVRRRMRQKLEFLLEDMEALDDPSQADLAAWLASHPDRYLIPARRAFRQVLASNDRRGETAHADATGFQRQLADGADPSRLGDDSLLPEAMPLTTREGVAALFGADFAEAVFATTASGWTGPVPSAFGLHVIEVIEREDARAPALEEVAERVRTDRIDAQRSERRSQHEKALRDRYQIRIDWPDDLRPQK